MLPQPAVPASTTAVTNNSGQTASVLVAGGTVTEIAVNGSSVATATNFTATVPAGESIAVTYSAAPTWYWSTLTPAVPASGTAVANNTGQDITVVLAGGTVTHVTVNGTDRATSTPANVMVPNGESVTLTYSAAPSWAWLNYLDMANSDSLGTAYASADLIPPTGTSGYNPANALPYASHGATGEQGFGTAVAN